MQPNYLVLNPRADVEVNPICPLCEEEITEVSGGGQNQFRCDCEELVKFKIPVK